MSKARRQPRPVVIRRISESRPHGRHGGAWKVAYADFVTAMMAFFLLLWLIGSASQNTLKGLADFFSDAPMNVGPPGGLGGVLEGLTLTPNHLPPMPSSPFDRQPALPTSLPAEDAQAIGMPAGETVGSLPATDRAASDEAQFGQAEEEILSALEAAPELQPFRDSFRIDQTAEGLRIQILDREQVAMFPVGSDAMYPHTRRLLQLVVQAIAGLPHRLSLRGHTDALPFPRGVRYDNWHLSTDRAHATRLVMVEAGLDPRRIADVTGRGDAEPLIPEDATDPRNRRISVVLLREGAAASPVPDGLR